MQRVLEYGAGRIEETAKQRTADCEPDDEASEDESPHACVFPDVAAPKPRPNRTPRLRRRKRNCDGSATAL